MYVVSAHSVMINVCMTEHWSFYMHSYTRRLSIYPECGRILSFGGLVMMDDCEGRLSGWEIQFIAADVVEKATKMQNKSVTYYKALIMHTASEYSTDNA